MQSCVLVRTEATRCWQEVIPDCWTVSYWPFSVIWHDSVFHADTLTHSDLCLICNTVFISMKRRPVGLTIWNKRKLEVGENGGEKQWRVKKKITEWEEQRSNVAHRVEISVSALGWSLTQQESPVLSGMTFCLLCGLLKTLLFEKTTWRSKFGRGTGGIKSARCSVVMASCHFAPRRVHQRSPFQFVFIHFWFIPRSHICD